MKKMNIISPGMIRRVNERLIKRGALDQRTENVYSSFLEKDIDISLQCGAAAINLAWKKASEQFTTN